MSHHVQLKSIVVKEYFFTFGQAHFSEEGVAMKDYYVTVTAPDYLAARAHFCDHFALPIMGRADKWAFQYEKDQFTPSYFPGGEYDRLSTEDKVQ